MMKYRVDSISDDTTRYLLVETMSGNWYAVQEQMHESGWQRSWFSTKQVNLRGAREAIRSAFRI